MPRAPKVPKAAILPSKARPVAVQKMNQPLPRLQNPRPKLRLGNSRKFGGL